MSVDPIDLYKTELAIDDVASRLVTMGKTVLVARAVGPAKASSEFLPVLNDVIATCPSEEVLSALSKELGNLTHHVASKADLLVLTEKLCKAEETFVRVAACESAQTVGEAMTEEEIASSFTPMLRRLIAESWWTAKVSAAALMATAYPKCTAEVKAELRASLMQITKDEAPMVRRAVARALGKLCAVFDAADVVPNLLPSLNKLANDDQDSVRILAFGSCLEMCSTQPADQCTDFIYPAIETFAKDASWRVRLEVARALTQVVESVVHAGPMPVSIVALMLKDPELDVRRFALEHSNSVVQKFPELAESSGIVRAICLLADVDPEVPNALPMKVLLAAQGVKMATLLGQEVARTYIIPMMVKLTQEESVEVRIAVLENWAELVTVAGGPAVLEAFPLSALCSDSSWRVRKSFLEGLPTLAATVPRSDFDAQLLPLLKDLVVRDQIDGVRTAGGPVLAQFGTNPAFGDSFVREVAEPLVKECSESPSCFLRISACQAAGCIAEAGVACVADSLAAVTVKLCTDKVANVRFNAAWAAKHLGKAKQCGAPQLAQLKTCMEQMAKDEDGDCAIYAEEALTQF